MRPRALAFAFGLAVLFRAPAARAHSIIVLVTDLGGFAVAEPVSGFVGAGGRLRLGFGSDPVVDALYCDVGVAGVSWRGHESPALYLDSSVAYRKYISPRDTDHPFFWSLAVRGAILATQLDDRNGPTAAYVGPAGEIGYRFARHAEIYFAVHPSFAIKSEGAIVGVGAPVMIGLDLTAF